LLATQEKKPIKVMVNPGKWAAMLQETRPLIYYLYICGKCGVLYSGWFDIRISIILAVVTGQGYLTGNIWREMLNQ